MDDKKSVRINVPTAKMTFKAYPVKAITYEIRWKKDWLKLGLVAVLTIGIQYLTSFLVAGFLGMVIGIVSGIGLFFLGLFAVTKTVTKTESN